MVSQVRYHHWRGMIAGLLLAFLVYSHYLLSSSVQVKKAVKIRRGNNTFIPRNPSAAVSWFEDVVSIQHYPKEQEIVVTFTPYARCPRPYLVGRLSGPALLLLQNWTFEGELGINEHPAAPTSTYTNGAESTMSATYRAPIGGQYYFLEIIALYCEDYSYNFRNKKNKTLRQWMNSSEGELFLDYDLMGTCMEDPRTNRLTDSSASLWVDPNHVQNYKGTWLNSDKNHTYSPLYTRWQPMQCFLAKKAGGKTPLECEAKISVNRFKPYRFDWNPPDLKDIVSRHPEPASFCLVGASHSGDLVQAGKRIFKKTIITTAIVDTQYPNLFTLHHPDCTHYIIATGQWPGSFDHAHPHSWAEWESDMHQMITRFQRFSTSDNNFYLRSIHYNPIGLPLHTCPPTDWRNPMIIDGYNAILELLSKEMGVPYFDTRWMDGAIWDGAKDWCHLSSRVNDDQILYLVASSLGHHK